MKDIFGINMQRKLNKNGEHPVNIQLAIIKMESDFDWLAKPPRQKLFKVIPFKRPSSFIWLFSSCQRHLGAV
jgi:hypothetical protein